MSNHSTYRTSIKSVKNTHWTRFNMTALGTMSIIVRRVMLKYDVMRSSAYVNKMKYSMFNQDRSLITSTSFDSFSDNVPDAFSCAGGASMAAAFFLFRGKKLPKKPVLASEGASSVGLAARGGPKP